ncbi:MAG: M20/M25/M40 family metallo-hydrolase [Acidobacteriales bacterium]|nr:M20/M25/M40 family metallo-hydrolase [Terriglobales bacterium]
MQRIEYLSFPAILSDLCETIVEPKAALGFPSQLGARKLLKVKLAASVIVLVAIASWAAEAPRVFDGQSWWSYVKVLASDKMEGRETGSPGLQRAEAYIVDQLNTLNLVPKGVSGFYQPVKFISRRVDEKHSHITLILDGHPHRLILGTDAFFSSRVTLGDEEIKTPLVFAGYGLKIPESNYDDLQGLDLKGKIAVIIYGSPGNVPSALAAHYQTVRERWKSLREAGAIGIISIMNPAAMDIPWDRVAVSRNEPSMTLVGEEFEETTGEKIGITFNPERAEQLFRGSGHNFKELAGLAAVRKPLPHFPLVVSIDAKARIETTDIESANVVAAYPGDDPELSKEYVVLSAHVDHLGIGAPINGDKLYNGAMDNASGCAVLLDIAHALREGHTKTRRSVLFVFVTGEEKGLLGSKYFAEHPTVEERSMVADINIDMFLPIVPLKLMTVYGLAESDLGDRITEAAKLYGIPVQPDPEPLRNVFIRSDQYNFVRHGIPALMADVGAVKGSADENKQFAWLHDRYHAPSDDLDQPVNLPAAALYEDVMYQLVLGVADDVRRPQWKRDSFFRRYAHASE